MNARQLFNDAMLAPNRVVLNLDFKPIDVDGESSVSIVYVANTHEGFVGIDFDIASDKALFIGVPPWK